ncbi:hypothetical protein [Nonlabens xiamenensis]|uniref:hypothetical protein n=1 Tax=Nonlabens xiamenensis TaxID=2341043 RepID=UPI000F608FD6|nr:hypothetical protein [Nonlabens xiamenensis]
MKWTLNYADLINLSHIERVTRSKINGILGYYNLKGFEVYIDFFLKQITLFETDRKGNRIDQIYLTDRATDSLTFKRKRHGIIMKTLLEGKRLKIALKVPNEYGEYNSLITKMKAVEFRL